jgi:hypothetical protein
VSAIACTSGECRPGGRAGGLENLHPEHAAGDAKLLGTEYGNHRGDPQHVAGNRRRTGIRLSGEGLLLRQRLERAAIRRQPVQQARELLGGGKLQRDAGDYVQVRVNYGYTPLFPGITVMSATGISSITMTSWMGLG